MSSVSNYEDDSESSPASSGDSARPGSRPASRRQSHTRHIPRIDQDGRGADSDADKHELEPELFNDAYRLLFNAEVARAAARFETADDQNHQYGTKHVGASQWSLREQNVFYAALGRLGRDDVPGIAAAIGTKTIPETQELLLLFEDASIPADEAALTLRDIPAAFDVSRECSRQLDLAAEALAWYEETCEANQEREKYGNYWLITPEVADDIETAIRTDRRRATTSPLASEPESSRRGGRVAVGACTSCKKSKQKCDREIPCGNCLRRKKPECVYPPHLPSKPEGRKNPQKKEVTAPILEAIPEATLLQPQVMLILSKTLFMNRSPTIPSPWAHWSEYTSDLAQAPAMYRSAFNSFHTLVLSVTKRLVQTAIIQATSRLRSHRQRVKKNSTPLVKRRDVCTAIDILGMKRDGQERWRGVARRCGLRVYDGKWSRYRHNTSRREVPWDEVEKLMAPPEPLVDASVGPQTTDAETSDRDDGQFKPRVARTGTPLPMENLALSDSSDGSRSSESSPPAPTNSKREPRRQAISVEQFDQNASRQEEHTLCAMLDFDSISRDQDSKSCEGSDDGTEEDENAAEIETHPDGWRSWTEYRPEWDELDTPISSVQFLANQKPASVPPLPQSDIADTIHSSSNNDTDAQTRASRKASKLRPRQTIELEALDARVYARQQGRATEHLRSRIENSETETDVPTQSIETRNKQLPDFQPLSSRVQGDLQEATSSSTEDGLSDFDMDVPAQSIETDGRRPPVVDSDDEGEMDWSTYIE